MAISGFLFLCGRIWEIVMTTPIVGMLGWMVHQWVRANQLTPNYILVLFIVATLALAWEVFTTISYLRARHDALFIAFTDLGFFGAFIAGVVLMRFIAGVSCGSIDVSYTPRSGGASYDISRPCTLLQASFAFGIICIMSFFFTFLLALLVWRHHRNDDKVIVERKYTHRSRHGSRNSGSREVRRSRDYDNRPRSSSARRSSGRQYYV